MATQFQSRSWGLGFVLQAALSLPLCGQESPDFVVISLPSTAPQSTAWPKWVALNDLVEGFNGIGHRAADLRRCMSVDDANAFDAVMLDLMSAIAALPSVAIARSGKAAEIAPLAPRFDRIPQIRPDLLALDKFFARLQRARRAQPDFKMLSSARKNVRRMLVALADVLPTVSSKTAGR